MAKSRLRCPSQDDLPWRSHCTPSWCLVPGLSLSRLLAGHHVADSARRHRPWSTLSAIHRLLAQSPGLALHPCGSLRKPAEALCQFGRDCGLIIASGGSHRQHGCLWPDALSAVVVLGPVGFCLLGTCMVTMALFAGSSSVRAIGIITALACLLMAFVARSWAPRFSRSISWACSSPPGSCPRSPSRCRSTSWRGIWAHSTHDTFSP